MKRQMASILCLAWVGAASAIQPRTGNWWNVAEPGRAFNIEIQDGLLVLDVYAYQAGGMAQWYLASGPMTNSGQDFSGTLDKYVGGQCTSCSFTSPTLVGNDGAISIHFMSETSATVTLPGGVTTAIRPFDFGFGDPPRGLLGEWVFIYDNVSTFAVKYELTTLVGPTANGNGVVGGYVVGNPSWIAACELQTSGVLAGQVVCGDADDQGSVSNAFLFSFGLDQTYAGYRVSSPGAKRYPMKGYKTKPGNASTTNAFATGALATSSIAPRVDRKLEPEILPGGTVSPDASALEQGQVIVDAIRGASNHR
jgi:hypothetical protein